MNKMIEFIFCCFYFIVTNIFNLPKISLKNVVNLEDYINIRYISIVETVEHSSKSYLSTLAVLQLDCILKLAKKVRVVDTKRGDKNQNQFEKMIKMEYELVGIGKVSLVVGIKRTNKEKVQYCITVIKT